MLSYFILHYKKVTWANVITSHWKSFTVRNLSGLWWQTQIFKNLTCVWKLETVIGNKYFCLFSLKWDLIPFWEISAKYPSLSNYRLATIFSSKMLLGSKGPAVRGFRPSCPALGHCLEACSGVHRPGAHTVRASLCWTSSPWGCVELGLMVDVRTWRRPCSAASGHFLCVDMARCGPRPQRPSPPGSPPAVSACIQALGSLPLFRASGRSCVWGHYPAAFLNIESIHKINFSTEWGNRERKSWHLFERLCELFLAHMVQRAPLVIQRNTLASLGWSHGLMGTQAALKSS